MGHLWLLMNPNAIMHATTEIKNLGKLLENGSPQFWPLGKKGEGVSPPFLPRMIMEGEGEMVASCAWTPGGQRVVQTPEFTDERKRVTLCFTGLYIPEVCPQRGTSLVGPFLPCYLSSEYFRLKLLFCFSIVTVGAKFWSLICRKKLISRLSLFFLT